jgi:hypothetical protein
MTPRIIQLEEIITIKLETITNHLKHIRNRLYKELHPEECDYE